MFLYIVINGYRQRCGRITALAATQTSGDLYHLSVRFVEGGNHAFIGVERFDVKAD